MPGTNLTRDEAAARAALVTVDTHDVVLDVTTAEDTFATTSTIRFSCTTPGAETFLDFVGASVEQLTVNGTDLDPASHFSDSRIRLTGLAADNEVVVRATGRFTNTGEGLHRFVDPVDDEVYLYTQFEVPDSRRMYPVFEQPDLKAALLLHRDRPGALAGRVELPHPRARAGRRGHRHLGLRADPAPLELHHRARRRAVRRRPRLGDDPRGRGAAGHLLPQVPHPLPRRRQPLRADQAGLRVLRGGVRLRLPVRQVRPAVHAGVQHGRDGERRVRHHQRGLRLPLQGARRPRRAPRPHRPPRAGAHVVRRPRDDAVVERPVAQRVLRRVGLDDLPGRGHPVDRRVDDVRHLREGLGLRQDQLSTTHPIVAEIRDLQDVEVNFDGITYAKGASVLKQLVAYVGRDAFRDGLRTYFRKHAWGNTTLEDLLVELEATSGRDLRVVVAGRGWRRRGSTPSARSSRSTTAAASPRPSSSRPSRRASRPSGRTASASACTRCATACSTAPTSSRSTSTASAPRCPPSSAASSPTCCSSTTTTWPTRRSASTSARSRPRWRTPAASPPRSPAPSSSPRRGT